MSAQADLGGSPVRRACFVLLVALGVMGLPRSALADPPMVALTAPAAGAAVRGVVPVAASADATVVSVSFDWSSDGGATWTPIGSDSDGSDGWTASWDASGYNGSATLRASATGSGGTGSAT